MSGAERIVLATTVVLYVTLIVAGYVEVLIGWSMVMAWVYDHETLTGALLALASALLGAYFLYRQSAHAERHAQRIEEREERRRIARRESARSLLPLALSSIVEYAMEAARVTKVLLDQCEDNHLPHGKVAPPTLPPVPSDAISVLRDLVAELQPDEIRPLSTLVADIQVQASRMRSVLADMGNSERIITSLNLEEYVLDCARIYARASSLFDFGRGKDRSPRANIRWEELRQSVYHFHIDEDDYPDLFETMNRRSGGDYNSVVADRWTAERAS